MSSSNRHFCQHSVGKLTAPEVKEFLDKEILQEYMTRKEHHAAREKMMKLLGSVKKDYEECQTKLGGYKVRVVSVPTAPFVMRCIDHHR